MTKVTDQKKITRVVQPEISHYICDSCGAICGTRANPKKTWHSRSGESHYCRRTCGPHDRAELTDHMHAAHGDAYPRGHDFFLVSTADITREHAERFPGCDWRADA